MRRRSSPPAAEEEAGAAVGNGPAGRPGPAGYAQRRCALTEALVTAEPWDQVAACMVSRDRIRAADADRERVLDTLGTAFVEGRLTEEEYHARAAWALASRTYGDLAAVTVSIPPRRSEPPPHRAPRTDLDRVDKKSLAWG